MERGSFDVSADESRRVLAQLLLPFMNVVASAVIVLFCLAHSIPGQFYQRGLAISPAVALLAVLALLLSAGLRWQRPLRYEIVDTGIDLVMAALTVRVPWTDIEEVVLLPEKSDGARRAAGNIKLLPGFCVDLYKRARFGWKTVFLRFVAGSSVIVLAREYAGCYGDSDSGIVSLYCRVGVVTLSPCEVAEFLRQVDKELAVRQLDAKVLRAQAVQISNND